MNKKQIYIGLGILAVAGLGIYLYKRSKEKSNFSGKGNIAYITANDSSARMTYDYKTTKLTNVWKEISEDGPLRLNSIKINSGHVLKGDIVTRTIEKGYKYSGTFDFLKVTDHKMGTGYILLSDLQLI